jgi:hypothetical protein
MIRFIPRILSSLLPAQATLQEAAKTALMALPAAQEALEALVVIFMPEA